MTDFRIALISDTHFCRVQSRKTVKHLFDDPPALSLKSVFEGKLGVWPASFDRDVSEGAARFVYERFQTLDVLVVTGDLATTGTAADMAVATSVFQSQSSAFTAGDMPALGFAARKCCILPGNHDRFMNNWGKPGSRSFDMAFGKEWKVGYPGAKSDIFRKNDQYLAIISADFCLLKQGHASPPMYPFYMGQGKAYEGVLRQLDAETTEARSQFDQVIIIWAVHFPAFESCPHLYKLIDATKLLSLAARHNVPIIVSGHLHKVSAHSLECGTQLLCAGSASSCEDLSNNWVHIIEISTSSEDGSLQSISRTNYKYDDDEDEFVQQGGSMMLRY